MKNIITHEGELNLNGAIIPCYVLKDGTRVLSGRAMQDALKMFDEATESKGKSGSRLGRILGQKSLKPFIGNDKEPGHFDPIICYKGDQKINGYEATILADICEGFLDARNNIKLSARQKIIADRAEILIRGFARVGIIALIDEATGYQHDREKDELQKILKLYISPELLPWEKRFPDEFYQEIFRLNGWDYTVNGIKQRPGVIGTWTKKYIYSVLPKGVLQALLTKTPRNDKGQLTKRLHQKLTREQGIEHLNKQLVSVTTLLSISDTWSGFERIWNKKFGQQELAFKEYDLLEPPINEAKNIPLSDFNKKLTVALNYKPKDKKDKQRDDAPELF